jgi:hypothetical protein
MSDLLKRTQQAIVDEACSQLYNISNGLHPLIMTDEQFQKLREAWIEVAISLTHDRVLESELPKDKKEDTYAFDRAMKVLK